ncbi:hypothetical protein SEA_FRANCOB_193 [Streptomyces phage Francob]
MEILFWIWAVPAAIFTVIFLVIALVASLINIQTGAVLGGLAIGVFGPPVAIVLGALWFISWPLFTLLGKMSEKRDEKRNAEYEERLSKGENYGKLMKITENYPHLPDEYLGAIVKVIQWHEPGKSNAYVEFVDQSIRSGRFYWRHSMMEEV